MLRLPILISALFLPQVFAHAMVGGTPVEKQTAFARSTVLIKFGMGNRCTGSIIGPRAILTAAHCAKRDPRPYEVVFTTDLTPVLQGKEAAEVRRVQRFVVHPKFRGVDGLSDDLAIAILDRNVPESAVVAALPGEELTIGYGETVRSLGFGIQNVNGEPRPPVPEAGPGWEPIRLSSKDFTVADPGTEELGGVKTGYHRIFVSQPEGGICGGDSGGPVYLVRGNDAPLLVGVNGAVAPPLVPKERWPICAETAFINRADTALPWIRSVLEENR